MLKKSDLAHTILRVGLGITFVWLGTQIWQAPEAWAGFLQPWAAKLVPGDLTWMMKDTAILDIVLGFWLIIGKKVWLPAAIGAVHILIILITTTGSWSNIVARDIGLLAACVTLFLETAPPKILKKINLE